MAHAFQPIPGNVTFRRFKESIYASDYIYNKKSLNAYLVEKKSSQCKKSWNQGNLFLFNNGQYIAANANCCSFNTSNLAANLYTKEYLKNICVVKDASTNSCSPKIPLIDASASKTNPLYYSYVIDPSGQLFGATPCGINNYANYMIPSLQGSQKLYEN